MELTQDLVIYLLGLAATAGTILARIGSLEKKVDKHNGLIERMYKVEEKVEYNSHRLDRLEEKEL